MSQKNGDGHFDWPEKTQIYAALAVCENIEEASELLQDQGLVISPRRLGYYQRNGGQRLQQMKQSGLAHHLVGQHSRHLSRVKRLDVLTKHLEQELIEAKALDEQPRDWAALLHRYRETMALVMEQDNPEADGQPDQQPAPEDQQQVHRGLSLLELISNGREPDETFEQLILDATRRVAAASGQTFPSPNSPNSAMETAT